MRSSREEGRQRSEAGCIVSRVFGLSLDVDADLSRSWGLCCRWVKVVNRPSSVCGVHSSVGARSLAIATKFKFDTDEN